MKSGSLIFVFLAVVISFADIPDIVLEWQSIKVIEWPGDDIVLGCVEAGDHWGYYAVVFNTTAGQWSWSLIALNKYGTETGRTVLFSSSGNLSNWVTPLFIDGQTLVAAWGARLESGPATLRIFDLSTTGQNFADVPLRFSGYSDVLITSIESLENKHLLLAGTGLDSLGRTMLFTAEADLTGTVLWQTELFGHSDFVVESTELEMLYDGSFMLSYEEDGFPSGIQIFRLDSHGNEMWEAFIDVECEFTAKVGDFLELNGGDILVAGTFDQFGQMAFRGVLACYDPALSEIWSGEVLYDDHTFLATADYTEGGDILCAGWTASEGFSPFEVDAVNVLLLFVDPENGELLSYTIEEEGSQTPAFIYSSGIGEYCVIGEQIPEDGNESDVFFGRVLIRAQF